MKKPFLFVVLSIFALSSSFHFSSLFLTSRRQMSFTVSMITEGSKVPKPNIITPAYGPQSNIDKFLMMYTCKLCSGRNAQMVR